eukprot:9048795-Alexandrium_andersonii.AAC.2
MQCPSQAQAHSDSFQVHFSMQCSVLQGQGTCSQSPGESFVPKMHRLSLAASTWCFVCSHASPEAKAPWPNTQGRAQGSNT